MSLKPGLELVEDNFIYRDAREREREHNSVFLLLSQGVT